LKYGFGRTTESFGGADSTSDELNSFQCPKPSFDLNFVPQAKHPARWFERATALAY
jgi:hypothetical protein